MQNEKLHTTTCPGNPPEIEHYRFTTNGNLQAYMYENLLYVHYGYNDANTRTYKYSFDLNPNWVNGRLESVNFSMHNAMFYPNSYLNFNNDGYYTKHYYNGIERIASRLGDNNLSLATHDPELQDRKWQLDSNIRRNIVDITGYDFLPVGEEQTPEDPKPIYELPVIGISNLLPSADGIYYYHSNHLGSTCYVTDENATVQQGFLYAPFGEITTEYNINFGSSVIPKYAFNAKELDEETGMYYYEARYYAPPTFTSRDPLFEKYFWISPYAYCANNPVKYVDPSGKEIDDPPAWKSIDPVIPKEKFVGWKREPEYSLLKKNKQKGKEPNCNDYAKYQLSKVDCYTTGGNDKRTLYPFSENTGVDFEQTKKSIEYIQNNLENGIPVFIGVDEEINSDINNGTTDHFMVIVGQGNDENGNYFLFYDNGTGNSDIGTSSNNKLYYNAETGLIAGDVDTRGTTQHYTLSEVRATFQRKKNK